MNGYLRYFIILLILFPIFISKSVVSSDSTFESLYSEMKIAMTEKNESKISELLAPDFYSEDVFGIKRDAKQMISSIQSLKQDPNKKSNTVLLSISIINDTAKIRQIYTMTTIKIIEDAEPIPIELMAISDDIWKKINGDWRMLQTVTKELKYKANNQVVSHLKKN